MSKYYVAYGSNLNLQHMKYRCPTARLCGVGVVQDYELQFKGRANSAYATIGPKAGATAPVAVWEIQPQDELALDRYEGYPSFYFKQRIPVLLNGKDITAMVYIMNLNMDFALPSQRYYQTVREGYSHCGLDVNVLHQALADSAAKFYSTAVQPEFPDDYDEDDYDEDDYEEEEDADEDDEEDYDEDALLEEEIAEGSLNETDPFFSSEGMIF